MAKRCAEEILNSPPSKRCPRGLCNVDMRLESTALPDGVSPPSLLALLDSRRRKRPCYFEKNEVKDLDLALYHKCAQGDLLIKHASNVSSVHLQTSGNFQESLISANTTNSSKRHREDTGGHADTNNPQTKVKADAGTTNSEDSSYNSFQFWRIPLPEVDMSVLQESSQNDTSDDMETRTEI